MSIKSNYKNFRFYSDDVLNTISLGIRNELGALIDAMDSVMGQTDINKQKV